MKKNRIALAVCAAAAMIPAASSAEGVDLYGKINIAAERVTAQDDNGTPVFNVPALTGDRTSTWAVTSYKSRLGVKGSLALDVAGLEGFYKAEYEIAADDGTNSNGREFAQRDIYAGLRGGFGELQLGRFNNPFKKSEGPVDQFNDYFSDIGELTLGQDRFSNTIQYATPKLADALVVKVAATANENQDDFDVPADGSNENTLADTVSASVVFEQGGLYLAGAIVRDQLDDLILGDGDSLTGKSDTFNAARVVAGLKVENLQLGALYQEAEENDTDPVTGIRGEETSWVVSGALRLDRVTLKAQHQRSKGDSPADNKGKATSMGADYALGKASKVYAYYATVDLEPSNSALPGAEVSAVSFGLEHKF